MISPRILVDCMELRWRQPCSDPVAPCLWNWGGELAERNPLPRGGHTQVAVVGAFSKTGCRRGGCVRFGHKATLARRQQLQRWRVEMCIFEWCEVWIGGLTEPSAGVFMHDELNLEAQVC